MTMLDDLKFIHHKDPKDALGTAEKQFEQLAHTCVIEGGGHSDTGFTSIVFAGMGGSALAALLAKSWLKLPLPFEVVRDYTLPAHVGKQTLVVVSSASGNTEETLQALTQAERLGATIAVITGGGALAEIAQEKKYALARVPSVGQPRFGLLYNLNAFVTVLEHFGLLGEHQALDELRSAVTFVSQAVTEWLPAVPTASNSAKQLALDALGTSVVMYGGDVLWPVAYKWKISFNENAKQVAWWGQYPEFNHNEFIGWSEQPVTKPYTVIDLRSSFDHERIQKRFTISDQMLSGRRPAAQVVAAQGSTVLEQLLWANAFGDFVSLYAAIAAEINPEPVELVEAFKKKMVE